MLSQLIYISTVNGQITRAELQEILTVARTQNKRARITGMLLFNGRRFLQVVEGPDRHIDELLHKLKADPRHKALVILGRRTVEQREFGDWDMAFPAPGTLESQDLVEALKAILRDAEPRTRAHLLSFAEQMAA